MGYFVNSEQAILFSSRFSEHVNSESVSRGHSEIQTLFSKLIVSLVAVKNKKGVSSAQGAP